MSIKNRFKATSISGNFSVIDTTDILGNSLVQNKTKIQRDLLVGQTITCNNLISNTGFHCGSSTEVSATNALSGQGTYLTWNRDGCSGKSYLINARGGGIGGFEFQLYDVNNNYISTPLSISGKSEISLNGTTGLGDQPFYIRGCWDPNHGIQYINGDFENKIIDGPSIWGFKGGQLGAAYNKGTLIWQESGVQIIPSTDSNDISSGALVINGGVGIAKNLNIGSDVIVSGVIYANGCLLYTSPSPRD